MQQQWILTEEERARLHHLANRMLNLSVQLYQPGDNVTGIASNIRDALREQCDILGY